MLNDGNGKMKKICVVQVISNLEYGGAQRQVVELTNSIDRERFDLHICSLSNYVPLGEELCNRESRLHIIPKKFQFDFTVVPKLARLLKKLGADIVHSYMFDADIAARAAGRLVGTRCVIGSERNTNYQLKKSQLAAYRLTKGWVDYIVANSNAGARFNSCALGHPSSMYRVIHNGVDTGSFFPEDGEAVRSRLNVGSGERLVGMFASFKKQKNHPLFFRAARKLLDRLPDTRLMFVGDMLYKGLQDSDQYARQMKDMVRELNLEENSIFLGNCKNVAELYNACDVTVLPSIREGTPNVLLESMACGTPVVATDISDNAFIVPDGKAGFIVEPDNDTQLADRLFALLSDQGRQKNMGNFARKWVKEKFSTDALAKKTEDVYLQLLSSR